jgi:uncharacterized phage infection (PIP) family protein YhgE
MSTGGGSGRNDVEFSIGADNAPLREDLNETERIVESAAEEIQEDINEIDGGTIAKDVDEIADAAEDATGEFEKLNKEAGNVPDNIADIANKVGTVVTALGAAVAAGIELNNWFIEIATSASDIKFQEDFAKTLDKEFEKVRKERAEKERASTDPAQLQETIETARNNLKALETTIQSELGRLAKINAAQDQFIDAFAVIGEPGRKLATVLDYFVADSSGRKTETTGRIEDARERAARERENLAELRKSLKGLEIDPVRIPDTDRTVKKQLTVQEAIEVNTGEMARALKNLKQGMTP